MTRATETDKLRYTDVLIQQIQDQNADLRKQIEAKDAEIEFLQDRLVALTGSDGQEEWKRQQGEPR